MNYEELEKLDTIEKIEKEIKRVDSLIKAGKVELCRDKNILHQWRNSFNVRAMYPNWKIHTR